jgi:hypothetical protein
MRQVARRGWLAGVPGLVLLTGLVLAGCTSDEPSGPAAAPAGASTTPGAATSTVASATSTNQPPTGGETDGDQPKACTLVTGAEAAIALGRPVGAPEDRGLGQFSSCSFAASSGRLATVTVQVLQSSATASVFDRIVRSQSTGGAARPVDGIGDRAVLAAGVLLFHQGSTVVTVLVYRQDQSGGQAAAEIALAKKIAAKL